MDELLHGEDDTIFHANADSSPVISRESTRMGWM